MRLQGAVSRAVVGALVVVAGACSSGLGLSGPGEAPGTPRFFEGELDLSGPIDVPVSGEPVRFAEPDALGRPLVQLASGELELLELPPLIADLRAPVVGGVTFDVDEVGQVTVAWPDGTQRVHALDAIPDGTVVADGAGRLGVLTAPSERYPHGVLGDTFEPTAATAFDADTGEVLWTYTIGPPEVFEALAPLWADVDDDGVDELLVTASGPQDGARVLLIDDGQLVAATDPIGSGSRWRHLLTVAPFGPDGALEAVDVRTPHIGGTVEFFSLPALEPTASIGGYSTHVIGSRNLDQWAIADVTGDGRPELIVPTQDQTELAILQRTSDGVVEITRLALGARLTTDIIVFPAGPARLVLMAGTDGNVRIWGAG